MKKKHLTLFSIALATATSAIVMMSNRADSYQMRSSSLQISEFDKETGGEHEDVRGIAFMNNIKANQFTGQINPEDVYRAIAQADKQSALYKSNAGNISWTEAGPNNVGGRTRAFLIDKDNSSILYAGGVGGGLWKSTTRGTSWEKVTPSNQDNLPVVSICQDNTGAIYIGTGEGVFTPTEAGANANQFGAPGFLGSGIWKSTDAGATWTKLSSTNPTGSTSIWRNVSALAVNKEGNRIFAGNMQSVYYSDNGGTTWTTTNAFSGTAACTEIKVATDGTIFAATTSRVFRSTQNGDPGSWQWKQITGATSSSRVSIGISPQDPNYVYVMASKSNDESLLGIWRSVNKGDTWSQIAFSSPENSILANQGFWNNVIAVDPENKDRVFAAGLAVWEWNYLGNWKQISSLSSEYNDGSTNPFYVHADNHTITFDTKTTPYTMYITNDGGVFRSTNKGKNFTTINKNYNVTQFYSVSANLKGEIIGGTQDNNTILIDGVRNATPGTVSQSGVRIFGGDGFHCEISRMYPESFFAANIGGFERSLNRGQSWNEYFDARISAPGAFAGSFNTPYFLWESVLDPTINDTVKNSMMFMCGVGTVWMTTEALNFNKTPDWFRIATISGASLTGEYTRSGNTFFVGTMNGNLFRISGLRGANYVYDSQGNWSPAAEGIKVEQVPLPGEIAGSRAITGISVHPTDSNKMVITCGNYGNNNYVFVSNNILDSVQNVSFTSIQNNLPKMPVYDVVINVDDANHIIIGTELGVWASSNNGGTWVEQNVGLTRSPVYMLRQYEWKPWEGPVLYAATHGRGIFKSKSLTTGIRKNESNNTVKQTANIYPNPASAFTNVEFTLTSASNGTVKVLDIKGKTVLSESSKRFTKGLNKVTLDVSGLALGNYFVRVETANEVATGKLIVVTK